jgi:hypothetical protein
MHEFLADESVRLSGLRNVIADMEFDGCLSIEKLATGTPDSIDVVKETVLKVYQGS